MCAAFARSRTQRRARVSVWYRVRGIARWPSSLSEESRRARHAREGKALSFARGGRALPRSLHALLLGEEALKDALLQGSHLPWLLAPPLSGNCLSADEEE